MLPSLKLDPEKLKGKLVALEGADGYGKTTLAKNLAIALREMGVDVHETRSPYGNSPQVEPFGQLTRFKEQTPLARWLVHAAAHAQHYQYEILPALAAGKTVVCDRFWWSALAYNLQGDGLIWDMNEDIIFQVERLACQGRYPDLVLLVAGRSFRPEFTERANFNQRVRDCYEGLLNSWHKPVGVVMNCDEELPEPEELQEGINLFLITSESYRDRSESEMVMDALRTVRDTFCPELAPPPEESAEEEQEEDE